MMIFAFPWLAGSWYLPASGTSVKDINGVILSVGSTVKVVGTVISISQIDSQHGTLVIQPTTYPGQDLFGINSLGTVSGG